MASAISHAFVASALGKVYTQRPMPWRFWVLSIICSVLPDADVIGFALGVDYDAVLGHRGLSHSVSFAVVCALVVVCLACRDRSRFGKPWWSLVLYFTTVTASHGVLDAMTNGGLGIAFWSPFDTARYFFAWRPVQVAPISISAFFSAWGLRIMLSEVLYIWLPTVVLYGLIRLGRGLSIMSRG